MEVRRPDFQRTDACPLSPTRYTNIPVIYESPRCNLDDTDLFPVSTPLKHPDERWKYLSNQAGSHQQDFEILKVSARLTPRALKMGMPQSAASRVRELHVTVNNDRLPEWLDVVSETFFNLEHLHLGGITVERKEPGGSLAGSEPNSDNRQQVQRDNSSTLRRLYVLYRLPNLKTLDGVVVSQTEQNLARPNNPNGQRVNRDDWVVPSSSILDTNSMTDDADSEVSEARPPSISANSMVEVDVSGALRMVALTSPDRCAAMEEKKDDKSPASSVACEWNAGCGSLALPYFRETKSLGISNLKLSFRRSASTVKDDPPGELSSSHSNSSDEGQSDLPLNLMPRIERKEMPPNFKPRIEKEDMPVLTKAKLEPCANALSVSAQPSTPKRPHDAFPGTLNILHCTPEKAKPQSPRIPPSQSLTSPFPMQFRVRAALAASPSREVTSVLLDRILPPATPPQPRVPGQAKAEKQLTVWETDSPPPPPPATPPPARAKLRRRSSVGTVQQLGAPVALNRVQSSPSEMMQARRGEKLSLPPPCPKQKKSLTLLTTPRRKKYKASYRWRKQSARSTSIMDATEDESDVSEEENIIQGD